MLFLRFGALSNLSLRLLGAFIQNIGVTISLPKEPSAKIGASGHASRPCVKQRDLAFVKEVVLGGPNPKDFVSRDQNDLSMMGLKWKMKPNNLVVWKGLT